VLLEVLQVTMWIWLDCKVCTYHHFNAHPPLLISLSPSVLQPCYISLYYSHVISLSVLQSCSISLCITIMLYLSVLQPCYISLCITVMFYLSLYYSHVLSLSLYYSHVIPLSVLQPCYTSLCITVMLYLSVLQSCYTSLCITAMLEARGVPPHMFGSLESNMRNIIQRSMCSSAMNKVTSLIKGMQTKDDEGQQLSSVMEMCQVGLHLVFHILQFNIL